MSRTVSRLDVINSSSFKITVNGLNVYTQLNVYYDNKKVVAPYIVDLKPSMDNILVTLLGVTVSLNLLHVVTTDKNGQGQFLFFLPQDYSNLLNKSETLALDYLSKDAGIKSVVVVDRASIDTDTLPDNYKDVARCFAVATIKKSVETKFNEVKDWGTVYGFKTPQSANGSVYTVNY